MTLTLPPELDRRISEAAQRSGQSKETFIMNALHQWLDAQDAGFETRIALDEASWQQFQDALDRPPQSVPGLVELFSSGEKDH